MQDCSNKHAGMLNDWKHIAMIGEATNFQPSSSVVESHKRLKACVDETAPRLNRALCSVLDHTFSLRGGSHSLYPTTIYQANGPEAPSLHLLA